MLRADVLHLRHEIQKIRFNCRDRIANAMKCNENCRPSTTLAKCWAWWWCKTFIWSDWYEMKFWFIASCATTTWSNSLNRSMMPSIFTWFNRCAWIIRCVNCCGIVGRWALTNADISWIKYSKVSTTFTKVVSSIAIWSWAMCWWMNVCKWKSVILVSPLNSIVRTWNRNHCAEPQTIWHPKWSIAKDSHLARMFGLAASSHTYCCTDTHPSSSKMHSKHTNASQIVITSESSFSRRICMTDRCHSIVFALRFSHSHSLPTDLSNDAKQFFESLLEKVLARRPTAEACLQLPFFTNYNIPSELSDEIFTREHVLDQLISKETSLNLDGTLSRNCIASNCNAHCF